MKVFDRGSRTQSSYCCGSEGKTHISKPCALSLLLYSDKDESNQTSQKPEPVSSQNLEHVPDADAAAVQVMLLYPAVLMALRADMEQGWQRWEQANTAEFPFWPVLCSGLHVPLPWRARVGSCFGWGLEGGGQRYWSGWVCPSSSPCTAIRVGKKGSHREERMGLN